MTKTIIIIVSASIICFVSQSCKKDPPSACFNVDVMETAIAGHEFLFTNCSKDYTSLLWDFGDGTTSSDVNPQHIYNSRGGYRVTLTATNNNGSKNSIEKYVFYGYYQVDKVVFTETWPSIAFPKDIELSNGFESLDTTLMSNTQLPLTLQVTGVLWSSNSLGNVADTGSVYTYHENGSGSNDPYQPVAVHPSDIVNNKLDVEVVNPPSEMAKFTLYFKISI